LNAALALEMARATNVPFDRSDFASKGRATAARNREPSS
jgi:hypothetical protein